MIESWYLINCKRNFRPNNQDWNILCIRARFGQVSFGTTGILTTTDKPYVFEIYNHLHVESVKNYNANIKILTSPEPLDFYVTVQGRYVKILAKPKYSPEPYQKYEVVIETPSVGVAESHIFQGPIYNINQTAFNFDFKFPY